MRYSAFHFGIFGSLLAVTAVLQSCDVVPRSSGKLRVIATTSIIGDWVHQISADDIDLVTLVGPDGDPHEYQPVPGDSMKLADASLIFENGLGLETWLDKLSDSARTSATRVVVTRGIRAIAVSKHRGEQSHGDIKEYDPHAWQSVSNAIVMVNDICDALVKADPAHASAFKSRTAAYDRDLAALDSHIDAEIHSIPKERRKLITSHDAFAYFGERYGIQISRNALESVTTEAADPSARVIAEVIDQIKASGVPVIFIENIQNPKLMNQIAANAHVKVGPSLYSDALGAPGSDGDTYIKMMRYNADTLVNSLKP